MFCHDYLERCTQIFEFAFCTGTWFLQLNIQLTYFITISISFNFKGEKREKPVYFNHMI